MSTLEAISNSIDALLNRLVALRPPVDDPILVAVPLAAVAILLVWQLDWAISHFFADPPSIWSRFLKAFSISTLLLAGGVGTILLADSTATAVYCAMLGAAALTLLLAKKNTARAAQRKQATETAARSESEAFAAAVEVQLEAADIAVGLFRNGLAPLEKRPPIGKETVEKLR